MNHESPPPPDEQIRTSPDIVSPTLAATPPAWPPAAELPPVRVARPFPLHPNFWCGLLWCTALVTFTQIPAALMALVVLVFVAVSRPEQALDMNNPIVHSIMGLAVLVAHGLIIVFSLLVLRVVVGRDWTRQ